MILLTSKMRRHDTKVRMPGKHTIGCFEDGFSLRRAWFPGHIPLWIRVIVFRNESPRARDSPGLIGIAGVDDQRLSMSGDVMVNVLEPWIVRNDALAGGVNDLHSHVLPYLCGNRALGKIAIESSDSFFRKVRILEPKRIKSGAESCTVCIRFHKSRCVISLLTE